MPFLDLLPPERVRTGLAAKDKRSLIAELAVLLAGDDDASVVRNAGSLCTPTHSSSTVTCASSVARSRSSSTVRG